MQRIAEAFVYAIVVGFAAIMLLGVALLIVVLARTIIELI